MDRMPMIRVASATSGFEAKLLAARLGSEGVVWELRPDVDGLYPVGAIEILVPADEAERARDVLDDQDATLEVDPWDQDEPHADDEIVGADDRDGAGVRVDVVRRHRRGLATAALALVIAVIVARLLAMG